MLAGRPSTFRIPTTTMSTINNGNQLTSAASAPDGQIKEQVFDYFLVLDFEATCDDKIKLKPQEIIEFPVLKLDSKTFDVVDTFHYYVQPRVNNQLTKFCTELTGITQNMVDNQPHLEEVLKIVFLVGSVLAVDEWIRKNGDLKLSETGEALNFIFVTCGDWDLKSMLRGQCKHFKLAHPKYFQRWINLKKSYCDLTGRFPRGMVTMLEEQGLNLEGRHHSGIDDCKNIARIVKKLATMDFVFKETARL